MNKEQNDNYHAINIFEMLKALWDHKFIIILFVIIGVTISAVKSFYFTDYTYTANGTIYLRSDNRAIKEKEEYVDANDILTARVLSSTYIETLNLRSFLMDVSEDIEGKYSWGEIKGMMNISIINETELMGVSVTAYSPRDAYMITKSILKLAPDKLAEVAEGGSIKIIDDVVMPVGPNSRGTVKNAILAGIVASVAAVILILILTLLDTKVRKGEDVEKRYGVSILGVLNN